VTNLPVVGSRADVLAQLGTRRTPVTLSQIRATTRHLAALDEPRTALRAAILHTYTAELLQPYWQFEASLQGFDLTLYEAPYGALVQEAEPNSGLAAAAPQLIYVFMRWEDLDPAISLPLTGLTHSEGEQVVANAVAAASGLVGRLRQISSATIVLTLLPRMVGPELGVFDPMAEHSDSELRHRIKSGIARELSGLSSALFCDLDEVCSEVGRRQLFDPRLWATSRFPFSVAGAQAVVRQLLSYAAVRLLPKAKCIVLDADNTLWGGVVGEDGLAGIGLGPDFPGSVHVAFQHRLLELQQRGFLLALCSKNNPDDVAEVLTGHPHQVLREEHFAAKRVNWTSKPENLVSLAEELNIGLESLIFVDDSAHECLAVRQALPQVTVVQVPSNVLELPYCLDSVARLEIASRTEEDRDRTRMYSQQRVRQAAAQSFSDIDEYLRSLNMVMQVGFDDERHVARIAQLCQKTNQFNLTTHRYSEADIVSLMRDPDSLVAHFSLTDIFGDSGLVGVAVVRGLTSRDADWDTLLMSCRVIGRRAEQAFVRRVMQWLSDHEVKRVRAQYSPTAKNEMVREFWPSVGFVATVPAGPDAFAYTSDLPMAAADPLPVLVVDAVE
jgi:FkbH-like protein